MTYEEIVLQALARVTDFGFDVPATRSLCYRWIGLREQALFSRAARVNPEWAGVCAHAPVIGGAVNLRTIGATAPVPELISKVEILDPGTSPYPAGTQVNLVVLKDVDVAEPPRATLRDYVIEGVGSDLDGVGKLRIYYSRLPVPGKPTDRDREAEIPEPHTEILVVGLASDLLSKALGLDRERKKEALALLAAEEEKRLADFDAYLQTYAPLQMRFSGPPYGPPR